MNSRFSLSLMLLVVCGASGLFSQPAVQEPGRPVEVVQFDFEPRDAKVGEEITIRGALRNNTQRLLLINARLVLPEQVALVLPEVEQIIFLEPNTRRNVIWRGKIVAAGKWVMNINTEVISEGRPLGGPPPVIPAEAKAALAQVWSGTWSSPAGFVYDANLEVQLHQTGAVEGRIEWTLKKAPADRKDYAGKEGQTGLEYVWGVYDPKTRNLDMEGYRRYDPKNILGLDRYRLNLAENLQEIRGATWNHGTWKAAFTLAPRRGR